MPRLSTYEDSLRYLLGLTGRGIRPGLERMERALALLGNPERRCPAIVVGGTNGKGSVSAMVAAAARAAGLRVGLFTSPHLHRLTERVQIDGREVSRRRLAESLRRVVAAVEGEPGLELTFFETMTAVAADRFAADGLDLAVWEVGLGGRLDATRLAPARVVVVTSIGLDHQKILGRSLAAIAEEKLALIRRGCVAVGGALRPDIAARMAEVARASRAPCWLQGRDFEPLPRGEARFDLAGRVGSIEGLPLPLRGAHQAGNAAVAAAACLALGRRGVPIPAEAIRRGLGRVRWPGRLELVRDGRALLDVAHNPEGARALAAALGPLVRERGKVVLVFGAMRDKDVAGIARPLLPLARQVLLAAPVLARALPPTEFPPSVAGRAMPSVAAAADEALELAGPDGLVVVTGSSFVVAEARAHLLGLRRTDPSIPM